MRKKVIHIISHSHWDREWYMPFEKHRLKLIKLIDDCMDLFDETEKFKSFHLDGQTIIIDDYLEIKPENIERLKQKVMEDRFVIGPWYILQDEFLVCEEASVRNLLLGIEEATKYGKVCKIGYFPDAFGNAGQMPQVLKQAGMEAVIFGRGVKPIGFNNSLIETADYESYYSETKWEAPDGSSLLGIIFANWYNNGAEIPVDEENARKFWDKRLSEALRYASTDHLLFMNGCDHQPLQKNITEAIELANRLYPEYEFIHSDFNYYIAQVKQSENAKLSTVAGELTSQATDGWTTLVNTASSRIYVKKNNRENETELVNVAEPISVMAAESGKTYPHSELKYAWKMLMQNHPHDSICGCSVDEVYDEMMIRYQKSLQVSHSIIDESVRSITDKIDTSCFMEDKSYPFVVFNTSGYCRTGVVSAVIDLERDYTCPLEETYRKMKAQKLEIYQLKDAYGRLIDAGIEDLGVSFGYDLPEDKFRQPFMARRIRVAFEVTAIPAMGYQVYALVREENGGMTGTKKSSLAFAGGMENQYLRVTINPNGTLDLLHKDSNRLYEGICYYEDTGDIGNEYIYRQPEQDTAILSKDYPCTYQLVEDQEYRATYRITQVLPIPESAQELLDEERSQMSDVRNRKAGRGSRCKELTIHTYVSLEKSGRGLQLTTEFENRMKDHRLRIILPVNINADTHMADSIFEIVKRPNRHADTWKNPSGCERQQSFVKIEDQKDGFLVANIGLYEYEVLPKENNAIALTLLRAVGEMGDWGVFPAPGAQCLGKHSLTIKLIPYSITKQEFDPAVLAYQFQIPMPVGQTTIHQGPLPTECSGLQWGGENIYLTSMKQKQGSEHTILRWINTADTMQTLVLRNCCSTNQYYLSNVIEERQDELTPNERNEITLQLRPFEILTLGIGH